MRPVLLFLAWMVFAAIGVPAGRAQFTYSNYGTSITITGYTGSGGAVSIPPTINSLPVTAIGAYAFQAKGSITSITIPTGVTNIGISAFYGCSNLESITIPANVTSIGDNAFTHCIKLTTVTIPSKVNSLGYGVFSNCTQLTSVSIPAITNSIGSGTFDGCSALTTITVASGNAFYSSTAGVLFSKSPVNLLHYPQAKAGAYTVPSGTVGIASTAFYKCTGLTAVTIPSSVTIISSLAFSECTSLTSLTIAEGLKTIDGVAFYGCTKLSSVSLPTSLTFLGEGAFANCPLLVSISVPTTNTAFSSTDGVLFNKAQTQLLQFPAAKAGSYTIPSTVTLIARSAFEGAAALTSVNIPTQVTYIDNAAFKNCSSLTTVSLPPALQSIAEDTFNGCSALTGFTIPSGTVYIGSNAFLGCRSITSIEIPSTTTSILTRAFSECDALTAISVNPLNATYSSVDGVLFDKAKKRLYQYPSGKTAGAYTAPATTTSIGYYAFSKSADLTSVTLPAGVTMISSYAFSNCINLTKVYLRGKAPVLETPAQTFNGAASTFKVYFFDDSIGFTTPLWQGYPSVNLGVSTGVNGWLISNDFTHDIDLVTPTEQAGVSLLMAYALGLNPRQNQSAHLPEPVYSEGHLSLSYFSGSADVTYTVETSTDLQTWTTEGVTTSPADAQQLRIASIPTTQSRHFLRLKVTR